MTDLIRIEFDVRRCAYHTQIDAVQVKGYAPIVDLGEKMRYKMKGQRKFNRKQLKGFLSLQEETNNKHRMGRLSPPRYVSFSLIYSCLKTSYADEIDDTPAQCLPLPQASTEFDLIQSSLCPISLAIDRFPASLTSSALMRQTTLSVRVNPFENLANPFSCLPVGRIMIF